jgi:hypothetical protein
MRVIITIIALCTAVAASGQIYIDSYRFAAAVPTNLLLDSFENGHAAYSLRKLDKDYSGSCITVRKTSGDTLNVGFVGNFIDTAAIKTFGGADTAFVSRWHDQSGNGYHLIQDTTGLRPWIYDGSALHYFGDRLAISFVRNYLYVPSSTALFNILHNGTTTSTAIVARAGVVSSPDSVYSYMGTAYNSAQIGMLVNYDDRPSIPFNNAYVSAVQSGVSGQLSMSNIQANAITPNAKALIFINNDADNTTLANRQNAYVSNGTIINTNTRSLAVTASNATFDFAIGRAVGPTQPNFVGSFYELVIWNADRSGNRTAIQNNINNFYSIY